MTGTPDGVDGPGREQERPALRRRSFLLSGASAAGGAAAALGGSWAAQAAAEPPAPDAAGRATVPFHGTRQAGVTTPAQALGTFLAFDLLPDAGRDGLRRLMRIWTDDIARLAAGAAGLSDSEPELAQVPARLTVTVGLGPGAFDAAELRGRRPTWLEQLPRFTIDRLQDRWTGGDIVLQVCADDPVTVAHAVRFLTKEARTLTRLRWVQPGFRNSPGTTAPGSTMRNLMGQVDGSRNLLPGTDDALIWHSGDPDWLDGGTSMVIRRIAMDLDEWDTLDRHAREAAVGRRLRDGAPLTGGREHDTPDLAAVNALGLPVIDTSAHIRRARTDDPKQRFLRRGYNYDDAPEPGRHSNSGLIFVTFQADPVRQFLPVQRRLEELDLLNLWTTPIGSAVFAVLPGCRPGEYLGQRLLAG